MSITMSMTTTILLVLFLCLYYTSDPNVSMLIDNGVSYLNMFHSHDVLYHVNFQQSTNYSDLFVSQRGSDLNFQPLQVTIGLHQSTSCNVTFNQWLTFFNPAYASGIVGSGHFIIIVQDVPEKNLTLLPPSILSLYKTFMQILRTYTCMENLIQ